MALEPLKINNLQSSILDQNKETNTLKPVNTLQDQILGVKKKDDDKKDDDKEKDKVSLSPEAQSFLNGANTGNKTENASQFSQDSLELQALQFRGLAQIATRSELSDKQKDQLNEIRENFSKIGINDVGILKLAQKKLDQVQQQSTDLLQLLNNNEITGGQFKQLNTINKLLNNSNGFGSEQVEGALQVKSDQLNKAFDEIATQNQNQKLSRDTLSNLEAIQLQLSSIQGYQLNVRDTVGPDGVVV